MTPPIAPTTPPPRSGPDPAAIARLPPETLYLPFERGPFRMTMGLGTVPEAAWFELDERYPADIRERRRLLAERHAEVFAALPLSDAARTEALAEIAAHLVAHRPAWFSRSGDRLYNRLTGACWDVIHPACDPLELAGRLVQEDLCLVQLDATAPVLTAAVLCFPSRWRLAEKLGRKLATIHDPVPHYAERLAGPVDRFMRHVKPGHIAARLNWSVMDDASLFQPGGTGRAAHHPAVTPRNAGETLFLRVERQTLRRLPRSGAVLFGIRVHVYGLAAAIRRADDAARLAEAVGALPEDTQHYKSLLPIREALLGWLAHRAEPAKQPGLQGHA